MIVRAETEEARKLRMISTMDRFFESAIKMLVTWSEVASDPELIRKDTDAVLKLGNAVLLRAERMCERSEEKKTGDEAIVGELVDEP